MYFGRNILQLSTTADNRKVQTHSEQAEGTKWFSIDDMTMETLKLSNLFFVKL